MTPPSIPVEKYGIRFDSQWELKVYEFLLLWFSPEDIRVHVRVLLYKTTPEMPGLSINIDFYVISQDFWIEAKGNLNDVINKPFKVKYHILHRVYPHCFNRLLVVNPSGGSSLPAKGKTTLNLSQLSKLFRGLGLSQL